MEKLRVLTFLLTFALAKAAYQPDGPYYVRYDRDRISKSILGSL